MRVLNESLPKGPVTDCALPGKTFIWLPFAGGISAFAVILPKPMGTGDRVVDGYPDAFHVIAGLVRSSMSFAFIISSVR